MLQFLQALFGGQRAVDAGSRGERLAEEWLQQKRHFSVVARNWRSPHDRREEIDLVCRDADVLVFVEVKARAAGALVPGYHAVDQRKKRVLRRAIKTYLAQLRDKPTTFRFDVVEVIFSRPSTEQLNGQTDSTGSEVLHFENVPLFPKHFRA